MEKLLNRLYFIVIPLLLMASTVALIYTISTNHKLRDTNLQLLNISKQLKDQTAAIKNETDSNSKQLQCIVSFFTQPDRANLVIKDPSSCFTIRQETTSTPSVPVPSPSLQLSMIPPISQPSSSPESSPAQSSPPSNPAPNCLIDLLKLHLVC